MLFLIPAWKQGIYHRNMQFRYCNLINNGHIPLKIVWNHTDAHQRLIVAFTIGSSILSLP